MGGLAILLIVTLYVVATLFVVRAVRGRRTKIAAAIVVILIPTADGILGRLYLKYLCETEGGAKIHRVIESVDGFMWSGAIALHDSDENSERFLGRFGVHFIESRPKSDGKVDRISLQGGRVIRDKGVSHQSTYVIRFASSEYGPFSSYLRDQYIVQTIGGKEIIATDTFFIFQGGWAEYLLASFSDAGPGGAASCKASYPEIRRDNLIKQTLKPLLVKEQ